jgi:nucleotide-binding universal stress UspA family protein
MIFKKIGLAVTFSPNGKALLLEARRLSGLFGAKLVLIHIGEKNPKTEKELLDLIVSSGIDPNTAEIFWKDGEPAKTILKVCDNENVELLIAGALEKEKALKYYISSIARKIMRESKCSVLIKIFPKNPPAPYTRFCVSTEFSPQGEETIIKAHNFAKLENAKDFTLLKEFQVPGLAMTVYDSGSTRETEQNRLNWQIEEDEKLKLYVKELNLTGLEIKTVCLYGKEGYEAGKYVKSVEGDLLVLTGPKDKLKFFDRVFQHDIEFLFENLPCDLLIVKTNL